ncbi:hypothetical protein M422DRAFT_92143, partial [Sphaerobolus stellatus SS14]
ACSSLNRLLPGKVAFPGSAQYVSDNEHWASSSTQPSTCTVEPSTPQDVATIFTVVNQTRSEWAVKSGGHAFNPGFSSTPGVMVSLTRFNAINYNASSSSVEVGGGNIWDDVYAKLDPFGVTVVGGRVPGVGVGGFTLGGGYSWKTQKFGLACDNVLAFNLVTPTSQILTGGGNNFGIVTSFVLKTRPQGQVWVNAFVNFDATNNDPNAYFLVIYIVQGGNISTDAILLYDAPQPPNGTFDVVLNTPGFTSKNIGTRSFPDFVQN